jgi:type II secretory pathway component PulC
MINKFKDFLKKLSWRRNRTDTLQDEILNEDQLPPGAKIQEIHTSDDEGTNPGIQSFRRSSWPSKLRLPKLRIPKLRLPKLGRRSDEDRTDINPLAAGSMASSFRDRLAGIAGHLGNLKLPEGIKGRTGEGLFALSPNISKSIERVLSRDARETVHQVGLVSIITLITYALGKGTALYLKGTPVIDTPRGHEVAINLDNDFNVGTLAQVRGINIFRTNTGLGGKKKESLAKCDSAEQESSLPIKLVNTVVLQDTVKSLASVQVRGDRILQEVREGEQISNLAMIFKITRLEILVKNLENGVCETISSEKTRDVRSPISVMTPDQSRQFKLNKKLPGIENAGNKFMISKALLDERLKDIASILTQARAVKIQNPDGTLAFIMTEMDPQGIFPYLGLQDQDIITSINGKPIYDLNEVMGLFARIKNMDKLQLGIKREGSESMLDYNIKK